MTASMEMHTKFTLSEQQMDMVVDTFSLLSNMSNVASKDTPEYELCCKCRDALDKVISMIDFQIDPKFDEYEELPF